MIRKLPGSVYNQQAQMRLKYQHFNCIVQISKNNKAKRCQSFYTSLNKNPPMKEDS